MIRVAIETSTRVGGVAVGRDDTVLAEAELGAQTRHAAAALPAVDQALRTAGLDRSEIDAVVVGAGPGSFTGVRVAGATAKGLAAGLGIPLMAYSSLLALAVDAEGRRERHATEPAADAPDPAASPVCGVFDARRGEVYAGCWRLDADALVEVLAPRVGTVRTVVEALAASVDPSSKQSGSNGTVTFVGPGTEVYREDLEAACADRGVDMVWGPADARPSARALLRLAQRYPDAGRVNAPAAWEPLYVRGSSAERGIRG